MGWKWIVCEQCGKEQTRHYHARFCQDCMRQRNASKTNVYRLVREATRDGFLPLLDGNIRCADCRLSATDWDHRDYLRPLAVESVCRSCNKIRGRGKNDSGPYFKYQSYKIALLYDPFMAIMLGPQCQISTD